MDKKEYEEEPVYYCNRCLSLNIRQMPFMEDRCYCGNCGASDVGTADMEEWETMYRNRYGYGYLEGKKKPRYGVKDN